jgi:hypothetical protein
LLFVARFAFPAESEIYSSTVSDVPRFPTESSHKKMSKLGHKMR